jgi:hypothetical protein
MPAFVRAAQETARDEVIYLGRVQTVVDFVGRAHGASELERLLRTSRIKAELGRPGADGRASLRLSATRKRPAPPTADALLLLRPGAPGRLRLMSERELVSVQNFLLPIGPLSPPILHGDCQNRPGPPSRPSSDDGSTTVRAPSPAVSFTFTRARRSGGMSLDQCELSCPADVPAAERQRRRLGLSTLVTDDDPLLYPTARRPPLLSLPAGEKPLLLTSGLVGTGPGPPAES